MRCSSSPRELATAFVHSMPACRYVYVLVSTARMYIAYDNPAVGAEQKQCHAFQVQGTVCVTGVSCCS
jgi:hypothetical protein